ncbi:hypothetical protein [Croceicoccus bisphenolivorans]|uniref:hypothetical protein n=1 Tax=Croceicoccus bisphenolivorans TaxID=1783232 RepID=UPI000833331D|nr:hypothetical protein [Croceicoccus bisphenolivorans]
MSTKKFISAQRLAVNAVFMLIMLSLLLFWLHALLDWLFNLGWSSDPQVLWAAPLMAIFGYGLRFACFTVFGFVEENF